MSKYVTTASVARNIILADAAEKRKELNKKRKQLNSEIEQIRDAMAGDKAKGRTAEVDRANRDIERLEKDKKRINDQLKALKGK